MSTLPNPQTESRWPHRLAVMLVCATFPLIWVGGLVTTSGAGMAVPDWPGTYGYNLFLYPWQTWIAGPFDILVEHGHRLFGALVGLITIILVVTTYRSDSRKWVQYLALTALGLVCFQGFLGGMRVRLNARTLAMLHGCTGPLFFAVAIAMAVVTSRHWKTASAQPAPANDRIARLGLWTTGLVYLQLLIGAQIRHIRFDASPSYFRVIVFFHLLMVAALVFHISLLCFRAVRMDRNQGLRRVATFLLLATAGQLVLGPASWVMKFGWPDWMTNSATAGFVVNAGGFAQNAIITAHVAVGSLILGLSLVLTLRANRLVSVARSTSDRRQTSDLAAPDNCVQMGVVV